MLALFLERLFTVLTVLTVLSVSGESDKHVT